MTLASTLFAPHYAAPLIVHCREAAKLFDAADENSQLAGELAEGEAFALLDITAGWAWGYRESDHRVGYVRASALIDG